MSLYKNFGPVIKRTSFGITEVYAQLKKVDFRPLKRLTFRFDPFATNAAHFRDVIYYLSAARIRDTNPKCIFKTEILSDRSDPELTCKFGELMKSMGC